MFLHHTNSRCGGMCCTIPGMGWDKGWDKGWGMGWPMGWPMGCDMCMGLMMGPGAGLTTGPEEGPIGTTLGELGEPRGRTRPYSEYMNFTVSAQTCLKSLRLSTTDPASCAAPCPA